MPGSTYGSNFSSSGGTAVVVAVAVLNSNDVSVVVVL